MSEWLRPIVCLAVSTGMRRGEYLAFVGWTWTPLANESCFPRRRTERDESCYLNKLALQVLEVARGDKVASTERVFAGVSGEQVSMAFRRAAKAAKIEDFRFMTFATPRLRGSECRVPTFTPLRNCSGTRTFGWPRGISICPRTILPRQ